MRIVKPMNEIAAEVVVASAILDQSRGSARSVPSICYHLINTPTPPIFIFKTLQIISEPPCGGPDPGLAESRYGLVRVESFVRAFCEFFAATLQSHLQNSIGIARSVRARL
jgi:hypothetical protein